MSNTLEPSGSNFFSAAAPAPAREAPVPVPEPEPRPESPRTVPKRGNRAKIREIKLAVTRLIVVFATLFTARYFYWRVMHTMNPVAKVFFCGFLVAEVLNFVEAALFYITTWSPTRHSSPAPLANRTVDVFIATYNEPLELLRETVLCAVSMSYPHKTFILDDGNRPDVKGLADELACGYITRDNNEHAKAGNLNNALATTDGEFILTLDADHVPSPKLIDEVLGFFADDKIAAVQTAQDFYNLDSFQHRMNWKARAGWQQQELFFSVIQPGKDRFNAAFYCGSPAILRRSALTEVGGFATETITEDMHTGLRLQKKGWRVLYHNKTLAYGLAPQTFIGFATQWQRWGSGCMQVLRLESPIIGRGLSLGQRICYFASMYFYWMSYQKLAYLMTPVIALFSGVFPLITTPELFVKYFFPYFFLNLFASVLLQGGFRSYFRSEQFNVLKMHVLMRTVVGMLGRTAKFKVTPKSRAEAAGIGDVFLPSVICLLLAAAMVVGGIRIWHAEDEYMLWALTVNVFWSAFYLYMMGAVVWSAMRRREFRSTYRFPSRLDTIMKVRYQRQRETVELTGYARNLNRTGASITLDDAVATGTVVDMDLELPQRTIAASGIVVRNQRYMANGKERVSSGIRFTKIAVGDQDEISRFLFWDVAPRESAALSLTSWTQAED